MLLLYLDVNLTHNIHVFLIINVNTVMEHLLCYKIFNISGQRTSEYDFYIGT